MMWLDGLRIRNSIWTLCGLTLTGILSIVSIAPAKVGTWTRKADMPTARGYLSTAVVNGKIYAIGGAFGATTGCSVVEEYDPSTDTWTQKSNLPVPRSGLSASVVNGKVYAIGGATSPLGAMCSNVFSYDPTTNIWEQKADMPTARIVLSTSVVNGKIYAIGGAPTGGNSALNTVEAYDPTTDKWTRKSAMPTARGFLSTSVVDDKIYAIGGASSKFGPVLYSVEEYDPVTDTWATRADMPTARGWFSTSTVAGRIYAVGGASAAATLQNLSVVEEYDPVTDTWIPSLNMPTARRIFSTSAVDGKIYAIGGLAGPWGTAAIPTGIVEAYNLTDPSPDFNGDGLVDIEDLLKLIESWIQDDPTVDIAPAPFGDGIVDALDLELLMSYWEQPVDDPTLLAHWAMDETEGDIAYDSAGVNDASVIGGTAWQPSDGQIDGALQLDGVDGCAVAGPVLNPAGGPFSVFAWIQGGEPGQVMISQLNGVNWLCLDPSGFLMTELRGSGRGGVPLQSEIVLNDGAWHRIGSVWDGMYRTLYVDNILVAEDTQNGLARSIGGLNIGCGSDSAAGTFWSGMIDDVRIYNRAVRP
jgi:N-acetylneuraminic acid mutarotase